ncbi:hypothetical protein A3H89_05020 [Candidatus Amesbacteria bacterium RIFCSPLOWO2_02_FULL_48_11]|uniref:Carrier domain-containing protein n=5 Tax=Candidatus Amesiibacteriota TaxID=1752730 RepID=A0A1F4Z5M4_9BACT|nr:MAG: hypothetical protein UX78_C0012G0028 [Candidatus Amesbacteria bacterium GW2011_GWA2_47_11]KKU94198.1 MAG: hypothetical protein UY22_C0015G0022 [Candidatus Amesbacteria bacterium GW2011_GWC1_48_10]KKW00500.1 MAG: hypothetical protein UY33_C0010G0021 [Candidatus Amesbacteria bacterium GW2011_GWA1_48_9]OGC89089.1 MAG: hypothetical protein A2V48_01815 [Candidatus Amesbacteria bacterium RBG_19FT_COMBO_48_16]OGC95355.1 MAG: hypothetical protein A3C34_04780 [Candidatus Amesbacteria bacterium R
MNPNLKSAIIEFLANEFQVNSDTLIPDTSFTLDLNLSLQATLDLLQRLQDALNFTLPEDKISGINTISDIFSALEPEIPNPDET